MGEFKDASKTEALCGRCGRIMVQTAAKLTCPACHSTIDFAPQVTQKLLSDRYECKTLLGKGGMGEVWLASDKVLGREVAVKLLTSGSADDLARFQREACLAAQISHPGIVPIHDVGERFLVMEYIRGDAAHLRKFSPREAAELLRQAALAVAHAHSQGIIHRDLKPANILVSGDRAFVTDFGLAKTHGVDNSLSVTGEVIGTPAYMSPEQARGESRKLGPLSDVYSLGATLYALVARRPPFQGSDAYDILRQVVEEDPLSPGRIPRDLDIIIRKAMAKDPQRRYVSAEEMAEDLRRYLAGEGIRARPESLWKKLTRRVKRTPQTYGLAAAGLVGAGVLLAVFLPIVGRKDAELERTQEKLLTHLRTSSEAYLEAALALRRAGDIHGMEKHVQKMQEVCGEVIRAIPHLAEPHYRLGRIYRAQMRSNEALAQQEEGLRKQPEYIPCRYERALLLLGRYGARIDAAKTEWWRRRGEQMMEAGGGEVRPSPGIQVPEMRDLEDSIAKKWKATAIVDLRAVEASGVQFTEGIRSFAKAFLAELNGNEEGATAAYKQALQEDPNFIDAYEGLARVSIRQGSLPDAIHWTSGGLQRDQGFLPLLRIRAQVWLNEAERRKGLRGNFEEAYEACGKDLSHLIQLFPDDAKNWMHRGILYMNWGGTHLGNCVRATQLFESADSDFKEALKRDSVFAECWTNTGLLQSNWALLEASQGKDFSVRFEAATENFRRGLELNSEDVAAMKFRAGCYSNWGALKRDRGEDSTSLFEASLMDYAGALKRNPGDPNSWQGRGKAWVNYGNLLSRRGRDFAEAYESAIKDYQQALQLTPEDLSIQHLVGDAYYNWGVSRKGVGEDPQVQLEKAVMILTGLLEKVPDAAQVLKLRGAAYMNDGRHGEAIADFERALQLVPAWESQLKPYVEACRQVSEF